MNGLNWLLRNQRKERKDGIEGFQRLSQKEFACTIFSSSQIFGVAFSCYLFCLLMIELVCCQSIWFFYVIYFFTEWALQDVGVALEVQRNTILLIQRGCSSNWLRRPSDDFRNLSKSWVSMILLLLETDWNQFWINHPRYFSFSSQTLVGSPLTTYQYWILDKIQHIKYSLKQ